MAERSDRELSRLFALDAGRGPARAIDERRTSAIIAGALGGAGFLPPPPGGAGGAGGAGDAGGAAGAKAAASTTAKGILASKLTVLTGGAITALATVAWLAVRSPAVPTPVAAPRAPVSSSTSPPIVAPSPTSPPAGAASEPATAAPSPASAMRETSPVDRAVPSRPRPSRTPRGITASVPPRVPAASGESRRRAPVPIERPPDPTPLPAAISEDLLAQANAARGAHRWGEADALYSRVAHGASARLAVQTALVASASIHLEHLGDPAGAARRFRAALASGPRDALAEDARWGIAEAARATGDSAAELDALADFLAHHAGSPRAPRARARRTELGAAP